MIFLLKNSCVFELFFVVVFVILSAKKNHMTPTTGRFVISASPLLGSSNAIFQATPSIFVSLLSVIRIFICGNLVDARS
jgi:hypothetical protein